MVGQKGMGVPKGNGCGYNTSRGWVVHIPSPFFIWASTGTTAFPNPYASVSVNVTGDVRHPSPVGVCSFECKFPRNVVLP